MYILSMYLTDLPVCLTDTERRRNTFDPILKMLHDYPVTERTSKCGFVRNHLIKGKIPNQFIYFGSGQEGKKNRNYGILRICKFKNSRFDVFLLYAKFALPKGFSCFFKRDILTFGGPYKIFTYNYIISTRTY